MLHKLWFTGPSHHLLKGWLLWAPYVLGLVWMDDRSGRCAPAAQPGVCTCLSTSVTSLAPSLLTVGVTVQSFLNYELGQGCHSSVSLKGLCRWRLVESTFLPGILGACCYHRDICDGWVRRSRSYALCLAMSEWRSINGNFANLGIFKKRCIVSIWKIFFSKGLKEKFLDLKHICLLSTTTWLSAMTHNLLELQPILSSVKGIMLLASWNTYED